MLEVYWHRVLVAAWTSGIADTKNEKKAHNTQGTKPTTDISAQCRTRKLYKIFEIK